MAKKIVLDGVTYVEEVVAKKPAPKKPVPPMKKSVPVPKKKPAKKVVKKKK